MKMQKSRTHHTYGIIMCRPLVMFALVWHTVHPSIVDPILCQRYVLNWEREVLHGQPIYLCDEVILSPQLAICQFKKSKALLTTSTIFEI